MNCSRCGTSMEAGSAMGALQFVPENAAAEATVWQMIHEGVSGWVRRGFRFAPAGELVAVRFPAACCPQCGAMELETDSVEVLRPQRRTSPIT